MPQSSTKNVFSPASYSFFKATEFIYPLWSEQLGLYLGIHQQLLPWFRIYGQLVPIPEETVTQPQEKAERLAAKLR